MIQYFKNISHKTVQIDTPEVGSWINILPPLKQEEFTELSTRLNIPIDFLTDSLDIDERPRFEEEDNVKLVVIKTPTGTNTNVAIHIPTTGLIVPSFAIFSPVLLKK